MSSPQSLENLRIAKPCPARWEDMQGDDRVRFCGLCRKNVFNLSALPRDAAERLVTEREGDLCALLYRRQDGTVLTADCPVGKRRFAVRIAKRIAAGLALVGLSLFGRFFTAAPKEKTKTEDPWPANASLTREQAELLGSLGYVGPASEK
jgi:hypothetical protein